MSGLKFKNGLEVEKCSECNGSGGCWEGGDYAEERERCDCCGGTGYDTYDYQGYMEEQEEDNMNEAILLFNALKHEVVDNAAFNWIEETGNKNCEPVLANQAQRLNDLINPYLIPEDKQHHDDAACLLMDMTDNNTHPSVLSLDPKDWDCLEKCINEHRVYGNATNT